MVSPADADAEAATRREDVAVGGEGGDPGAAAAAAARANADPGRKKVLRVRTFKNKMQIILNLSNIDTLPDVFIYPEAAVSLAVLILALSIASESTAELEEAVRRETGVETNVMPILKPSGLLLNNYDIQFTYRLTEQGYFFIILLTMFALFFSDRPQFMQMQFATCGAILCLIVGLCRLIGTLQQTSPPTLNVGLDDTNSTSRLFRGVRYVPVSIPRQGGGGDVSRISLEGADPCGPSFEQLQAQIDAAWNNAMELSKAIGGLLLLLFVIFTADAVMRMRRDCLKARFKFNPWPLFKMPSVLMIPKLIGAWGLYFLFRFGHQSEGRSHPVYPSLDTVVVNTSSGEFFKHSETAAALQGDDAGHQHEILVTVVFVGYAYSYTVLTLSILLNDRLNMLRTMYSLAGGIVLIVVGSLYIEASQTVAHVVKEEYLARDVPTLFLGSLAVTMGFVFFAFGCVFFVVQRVDEEEVGEEAGADVAAQEVAAEDEAQAAAAAEAAKAKSTTAAGGGKNDPANPPKGKEVRTVTTRGAKMPEKKKPPDFQQKIPV